LLDLAGWQSLLGNFLSTFGPTLLHCQR